MSVEDVAAVEIRAILDASAILSYARGHVHIGEILVEIAEEGVDVGIPAVAALSAYDHLAGDAPAIGRLDVLLALPGVQLLDLGRAEVSAIAPAVALTGGDLAQAHAVWAALEHGAYYLTTEPDRAPSILTADQVHHIPAEDA